MMPIYGFLEGDTIGLLVLAGEQDTAAQLADKLQQAARVRVGRQVAVDVIHRGRRLDPSERLGVAGVKALDRIDVVRARS